MIDCFVSCFRIKPHNNEALKVCLNPTSAFIYHYVLISSLYRYDIFAMLYTYVNYLELLLWEVHYSVHIYGVIFICSKNICYIILPVLLSSAHRCTFYKQIILTQLLPNYAIEQGFSGIL